MVVKEKAKVVSSAGKVRDGFSKSFNKGCRVPCLRFGVVSDERFLYFHEEQVCIPLARKDFRLNLL